MAMIFSVTRPKCVLQSGDEFIMYMATLCGLTGDRCADPQRGPSLCVRT